VMLRSLPGTATHEIIGLLSLILYMGIPVYFIIKFATARFGKTGAAHHATPVEMKATRYVLPILLFAMLFLSFAAVKKRSLTDVKDARLAQLQLPGFTKRKQQDGVIEFRNERLLVYIKPAVRAFQGDHPPVLCWKGSGFDAEQVAKKEINGVIVLKAILKKGSTTQYTAWWYDNGSVKTTDQWTWRLSHGEPFRIINITSDNEDVLYEAVSAFLKKKLF
jgi:exosortase N